MKKCLKEEEKPKTKNERGAREERKRRERREKGAFNTLSLQTHI